MDAFQRLSNFSVLMRFHRLPLGAGLSAEVIAARFQRSGFAASLETQAAGINW
jgi:hypothetical protein